MKAWRWMPAALAASALAAGCGGGGPSVPAVSNKAAVGAQAVEASVPAPKPSAPVMPKAAVPGPPLPPLAYEAKNRRDPFAAVVVAKDKPTLEVVGVKLVGVIRGQQLMALVEAPDGLGYILKPGDVLGNGRVTDITLTSVTFGITGRAGQPGSSVSLKLSVD